MRVEFPNEHLQTISDACKRAGINEIGGMLFGEQIENGYFKVVECTVDERGLVASFLRSLQHVTQSCKRFFKNTSYDYSRFNYLGEWHSHPSYEVYPSSKDDRSMWDIVCDQRVGANFVVLTIVRLSNDKPDIGCWAYFPDGTRVEVEVKILN